MVLIGAHNQAAITRQFRESLTDTATIARKTVEADGFGSQTETYTEIAQAPCRLAKSNQASAIAQAGGIKAKDIFVLTVPADADVVETDRVTVDGITYEITGDCQRGTWTVSKRFYVRRFEE